MLLSVFAVVVAAATAVLAVAVIQLRRLAPVEDDRVSLDPVLVAELEEIAEQAQDLKDFFLAAIDDDTNAFNAVMDSFGLPKNSPAQAKARDLAGQCDLLFRRNSKNGSVECLTNKSAVELNDVLHSHN